ncbi:GNAT family N-acetyltransferase [Prochlorococcus sp. MIT 1300]|uniref:GNAT family N-acetyltransferase n=1 Tax=Prochlorococcus sp. MIT 1300 TaxID=3096218 RepID=UPI002A74FA27|nr:GNAT family N-acetyltransferase [Prochlorococcus sp. MIT 1300]
MSSSLQIRSLQPKDIAYVTNWSRVEGFAPGAGDLNIYRHTDRQGLWVGLLNKKPIGCIAGVRYNANYGFIGLFLVVPEHRGHGFGLELWKHALKHLEDLPCIGLEAALNRINDYSGWGFHPSSPTTRWQCEGNDDFFTGADYSQNDASGLMLLEGGAIPSKAIEVYDAKREPSPRPHFLFDWLKHPAGKVLAIIDNNGQCHGFGRIRPCLLKNGEGWRVGPLLADTNELAELLLKQLIRRHRGTVLIDTPGLNQSASHLCRKLGFKQISQTLRMYRGELPPVSMKEVYGLACLELG